MIPIFAEHFEVERFGPVAVISDSILRNFLLQISWIFYFWGLHRSVVHTVEHKFFDIFCSILLESYYQFSKTYSLFNSKKNYWITSWAFCILLVFIKCFIFYSKTCFLRLHYFQLISDNDLLTSSGVVCRISNFFSNFIKSCFLNLVELTSIPQWPRSRSKVTPPFIWS